MLLYFKEPCYNWGDTFFVMGEDDKRKYRVKTSVLLWNKKFEVSDMDHNPLFTIKNEPKSLLKKKYYILFGDEQKAAITKELSLIPKFIIEGINWQFKGYMNHSYEMTENGQQILSFEREHGNRFELTIPDPRNELMALAVAMTITYVMNAESSESSSVKL